MNAKKTHPKHNVQAENSSKMQPKTERANRDVALPSVGFPVVGVGASAGGLDAFTLLLKALPDNPGMAFVYVSHLDPEHKSMLPEILGRATRMPVAQVVDGDHVKINYVYIIPPNTNLGLENLVLRLTPFMESRRPHLPVDFFLRALAEDQNIRAIGIVLSGTGSDGALGMEFIKSNGGITFAQQPNSAKYGDMPRASIETDCVDFVLSPEKIAHELMRIKRHPYVQLAKTEKADESALEEAELKTVFALLKVQFNVDFTYYKHSTIRRRILRRMALHRTDALKKYIECLRTHPAEVGALYQDILIHVTNFFRDPQVFEALKHTILPTIVKNHVANAPIRIWVPGCSTGEEVYSIVMCLMEILPSPLNVPPQIFATDISDTVLEKARAGIYRDNISLDVSPERLNRFFVKLASGGYQVCKAIREGCVFAKQNVFRDPPFSKLDLISCRNLLIYLEPVLQEKILGLFHFALTPGGYLVLGSSESTGRSADLFALEDRKHKFYVRKETPARVRFEVLGTARESTRTVAAKLTGDAALTEMDVKKAADLMLLSRLPASVLIDEEFQILQFRGHTGDYLEHPSGNASLNLLKIARVGLLPALRTAFHETKKSGSPVRKDDVTMEFGKRRKLVNIEVLPVKTATARWHFLVLFEEKKQPESSPEIATETDTLSAPERVAAERRIAQLEHELTATRDFLMASSEEEQKTAEELKVSSEEILSNNEELQSTNEELQTAKEELESSNEELKTVNDELQNNLEQAAHAKEYLEAVVDHASKALLVLDGKLLVKKANKCFCQLFRTSASESEGKLIYNLGDGQWNIADLRKLLEQILPSKNELKDFEVTHDFDLPLIGRRTMLLDAHEIHFGGGKETAILLGFEDISERK